MSFERQNAAFLSSMSTAAAKIPVAGAGNTTPLSSFSSKRGTLAPPSPSPSVGSVASAAAGGGGGATPRKDREPGSTGGYRSSSNHTIVYSQPAATGIGDTLIAHMTFLVQWLRNDKQGRPVPCADVLQHWKAAWGQSREQKVAFIESMRNHPHIQWTPDPALSEQTYESGSYAHRPLIPGVRDGESLIAYLQRKTDFSGVGVKELKDGWPDCEAGIDRLEADHRILVDRRKKDGAPKAVWLDDPTLFHDVEKDLKDKWHRIEIGSVEQIVQQLQAAGQKPASEDPRLKTDTSRVEKKKKKASRKNVNSTNTHMMHKVLKDFDFMKR